MKEKIIYVADDGTEFSIKESCATYEDLLNRVRRTIAFLKPNKDIDGHNITVRHDPCIVKQAFHDFLQICETTIPDNRIADMFRKARTGSEYVHPSHLEYHLSDYSKSYPILWSTFCRFQNINFTSGIEYTQPYYVYHENEWKWEIH